MGSCAVGFSQGFDELTANAVVDQSDHPCKAPRPDFGRIDAALLD